MVRGVQGCAVASGSMEETSATSVNSAFSAIEWAVPPTQAARSEAPVVRAG
jgi:hypothetical protein